MAKNAVAYLAGQEYEVRRQRLDGWLAFQTARERLEAAVTARDSAGICEAVWAAITAAIPGVPREILIRASWTEAVTAYATAVAVNRIPGRERFAILTAGADSMSREPWTYTGRIAAAMVHLIASAYGWSRREILRLWPDEAWAYIQEILAQRHEDREFLYSLSDMAYEPVGRTGRVRFRPLPKPRWLQTAVEARPQQPKPPGGLPARLVPGGLVVRLDLEDKVQ